MASEDFKIGLIGGTGLNNVDILKDAYEIEVDTIFGKPSDKLICGKINNVNCVLLSRHGMYKNQFIIFMYCQRY